jgi:hypothetical protein
MGAALALVLVAERAAASALGLVMESAAQSAMARE